jgi:hypothetical protein
MHELPEDNRPSRRPAVEFSFTASGKEAHRLGVLKYLRLSAFIGGFKAFS